MRLENAEEIKEKLVKRQREILRRVENLEVDIRRKNGPLESNLSEQSLSLENNEVVDALDVVERGELISINRALERLEKGGYGLCLNCNGIISEKRLVAIPHALFCISCAQKKQ